MNDEIELMLNKVRMICSDIEVFVSYTYSDKDMVKPLIDVIEAKDYSVWQSEVRIKTGDSFVNKIEDAIRKCTYKNFYIVVISENSVNSSHIKSELEFASSEGAFIIPIIIGKSKLPEDIAFY